MKPATRPINIPYLLILGTGLLFLSVALIYSEGVLTWFDTDPPAKKVAVQIGEARWLLVWFGLGSLFISELIRRQGWLSMQLQRPLATNILLSILSVTVPLSLAEISLKPFARSEATPIFMRDSQLGWRLRPNASGTWGGVPIKINDKGLRGPTLDYNKPENVFRILYLGDSVTFGFLIEDDADTFPAEAERLLEAKTERQIETINAGVGGYSPWQQARYLADEGLKYEPDLIIVSFVLNDVTEKFQLAQFGGKRQGYQVEHTLFTTFDRWASRSSILYHLKQVALRLQASQVAQTQIRLQEKIDVEMLAHQPDHPDIQAAWQITLDNLNQIFQLAKHNDIPIALIIFPFTFQFDDIEGLSAPQHQLTQFAEEHHVPTLNLLPVLSEKMKTDNLPPDAYFFDEDHLSHYGSEVVAEMIVEFLQEMVLEDNS